MHFNTPKLSGILEKFSFISQFYGSKMQKSTFLEINCFLSECFYQIEMKAATNGLAI